MNQDPKYYEAKLELLKAAASHIMARRWRTKKANPIGAPMNSIMQTGSPNFSLNNTTGNGMVYGNPNNIGITLTPSYVSTPAATTRSATPAPAKPVAPTPAPKPFNPRAFDATMQNIRSMAGQMGLRADRMPSMTRPVNLRQAMRPGLKVMQSKPEVTTMRPWGQLQRDMNWHTSANLNWDGQEFTYGGSTQKQLASLQDQRKAFQEWWRSLAPHEQTAYKDKVMPYSNAFNSQEKALQQRIEDEKPLSFDDAFNKYTTGAVPKWNGYYQEYAGLNGGTQSDYEAINAEMQRLQSMQSRLSPEDRKYYADWFNPRLKSIQATMNSHLSSGGWRPKEDPNAGIIKVKRSPRRSIFRSAR